MWPVGCLIWAEVPLGEKGGEIKKDTPRLIWSQSAKTPLCLQPCHFLLMSSEGVCGGGHLSSSHPGGIHHSSGLSELSCYTVLARGLHLWLLWAQGWRRQWHPTPVRLPGKIPWTEEPGRLQTMGSRRVGHHWATSLSLFPFMHWRRKWQPTPVFLPGESQGRGSLVGRCLWGRTESDTTEVT